MLLVDYPPNPIPGWKNPCGLDMSVRVNQISKEQLIEILAKNPEVSHHCETLDGLEHIQELAPSAVGAWTQKYLPGDTTVYCRRISVKGWEYHMVEVIHA